MVGRFARLAGQPPTRRRLSVARCAPSPGPSPPGGNIASVPSFEPRWTDAQRRGVVGAVLDDGLSVREALRRARGGQLADLPGFDMPRSTARAHIARERR